MIKVPTYLVQTCKSVWNSSSILHYPYRKDEFFLLLFFLKLESQWLVHKSYISLIWINRNANRSIGERLIFYSYEFLRKLQ